jgi:hypothetical protein
MLLDSARMPVPPLLLSHAHFLHSHRGPGAALAAAWGALAHTMLTVGVVACAALLDWTALAPGELAPPEGSRHTVEDDGRPLWGEACLNPSRFVRVQLSSSERAFWVGFSLLAAVVVFRAVRPRRPFLVSLRASHHLAGDFSAAYVAPRSTGVGDGD